MQQGVSQGGQESRGIIFYPGIKPGVNEQMRAMFAKAHILVLQEVWKNPSSIPRIEDEGVPYEGAFEIGIYVKCIGGTA
jgi:hypothetical protein